MVEVVEGLYVTSPAKWAVATRFPAVDAIWVTDAFPFVFVGAAEVTHFLVIEIAGLHQAQQA